MSNLKTLKTRIQSVRNTGKITKAVKMIAATKLRRAQGMLVEMERYDSYLRELRDRLGVRLSVHAEYARQSERVVVVVMGSNRGLAGSFNNLILKEALQTISRHTEAGKNVEIVTIGTKIRDYFTKRDVKVQKDYSYFLDKIEFELIKSDIEKLVLGDVSAVVEVVYSRFKNAMTHVPTTLQVYPLVAARESTYAYDYIIEPSAAVVQQQLDRQIAIFSFYKTFLHSYTCEQGARMTAMDKANENAKVLEQDLSLSYNRLRQAIITNEILEISSAAKALKI